ncbi:S-layer homology domain-containing protein [Allocoleopsis franciscana]|uniref:Putative S-layer protein n=1 Tax=Allocoleopsis franciscana PCC 7113 TaxID=1173027 RepID=K9WDM3_9CYAN|nr:S-layer homology domain-containing protein [Allocoleopsis franciscana]AFZ17859.1 putative S-layer protein [Allocoleopsis franciscana PCC 7113]
MNLSLIASQRGLILAVVGIVLAEMTTGISASVAAPTNASSMKLPGQEESVELAQQLSVSQQMTKDKEEKTDKDDDDDKEEKTDKDDDDDNDNDDDNESMAQECSCKDAVFKDVSQKTGVESSKLRIVKVEKETWSDGCLGLGDANSMCTQSMVPGWRVIVASGSQSWVYRTNLAGTVAKWDEVATQTLASSQTTTQTTSRREVITRTSETIQSVTGGTNQSSQAEGSSQIIEGVNTGIQQQTRMARRSSQVSFSDISESYWARGFIMELAQRGILTGFPDGKFYPDKPVTRAEFAALLASVFKQTKVRDAMSFRDVSANYWAYDGIREAYEMGFLGAASGSQFKPYQSLTRLQILTALAKGLNYTSSSRSIEQILSVYRDAGAIPAEARSLVAAATERGIVVNYPNSNTCSPNKVATRAEVAAFLYQAMVNKGEATKISSPYIVGEKAKFR